MKPEVLQCYRNLLIQRIQDLLQSAGYAVQFMRESGESMPDICDQAVREFFHTISFSLRDKERETIREIREAIRRIDEGTFGICRLCNKRISEKRMLAHPSTTLCIDCKR
ncbi:MAG: TraR/DksA C4-type zinc finger protein, partial [Deltaproteobacteria bacterium]|nr:TraR/DksA C4-type zinc finger protein [Deltaproteobacteria bacterium]